MSTKNNPQYDKPNSPRENSQKNLKKPAEVQGGSQQEEIQEKEK